LDRFLSSSKWSFPSATNLTEILTRTTRRGTDSPARCRWRNVIVFSAWLAICLIAVHVMDYAARLIMATTRDTGSPDPVNSMCATAPVHGPRKVW